MKNYVKRRGFTLVELLIVIVVIGVLSAMMLLSSTEASSSAKAAKIISDLTNLKTAALAYYADNLYEIIKAEYDVFDHDKASYDVNVAKVLEYMNGNTADKIQIAGNGSEDYKYSFGSHSAKSGGYWYVWCRVPDMNVRKKLEARADSIGLVSASKYYRAGPDDVHKLKASDKDHLYVGLYIRGDEEYK